MSNAKFKAIRCIISRGGFSDERLFRIDAGGMKYEGVASRQHMWSREGVPLADGEPPIGENIEGLVAARIIKIEDGRALVSVPDGEVITISTDQLVDRPTVRVAENVSVG
jgi:hypothetical protein